MRFSTSLLLGLLGATAHAHTVMQHAYINGKSPGLGVCLRLTKPGWNNSPIASLSSNDMACGIDGTIGAARTCAVKGGDTLTFQFHHAKTQQYGGDYLDATHEGPCSVMMKKVDSARNDTAAGDGWFRIAYEDYNPATGTWCTDRVAQTGLISAVLPTDLVGGDYLVRVELLALHAAANPQRQDPQFYVSCMQVFLDSAGSARPTDTVAIPSDAYAKLGDEAMSWNLYNPSIDHSTYPGYGPPTYVSSGAVDPNAKFGVTQTEGLRPTNCILEARNFCATPEPSYTTETECWTANQNCWDQHTACYSNGPMSDVCERIWAPRCEARAKICKSEKPTGPETKDLTPTPPTIVPPPPFDTSAGSGNVKAQSGTGSSGSSGASGSSASYSSSYSSSPSSSATDAPAASPTASPSETATADAIVASPDVTVTDGSSSASPPPAPTSSSSAAVDDGATCASVSTETVTEVVTVTATTTATADASASGNGNHGYGYGKGNHGHGYRRARRA